MKKRRSMCLIFIFSSLCSCSRIPLPYCHVANIVNSTVTRMSGLVVVGHV